MLPSTALYFQRSSEQLSDLQASLGKSQAQLGSGERVINPSDDPRAATEVDRLQTSIRRIDSYQDTIQTLDIRMSVQDKVLKNISDVLVRIKELGLLGANDSFNAQDRQILALEARELSAELAEIANIQDQSGNYVFGGTRVSTPPYQPDEDGVYQYTGDHSDVMVPISPTRSIVSHSGGQDIFGGVLREPANQFELPAKVGAFEALNDLVTALDQNDVDGIYRGLSEVDTIAGSVNMELAQVGSRRNTLEGQKLVNEETQIQFKSLLSDLKDLDYAEKITEFQAQMTALQAAQSSFSKISQLSLWNYLD